MRRMLIALATSLGVAVGSFGVAVAPAAAAMPMTHLSVSKGDVVQISHKKWHKRKWSCHVHWKKKKIWRYGHWAWISVPVRHCHWVWWHPKYPHWW